MWAPPTAVIQPTGCATRWISATRWLESVLQHAFALERERIEKPASEKNANMEQASPDTSGKGVSRCATRVSGNAGTPIFSLGDLKRGRSSTRSVVTRNGSLMPTAFRFFTYVSLFDRTIRYRFALPRQRGLKTASLGTTSLEYNVASRRGDHCVATLFTGDTFTEEKSGCKFYTLTYALLRG